MITSLLLLLTGILIATPALGGDFHLVTENMRGERVSRTTTRSFAGWLMDWPDVVFVGRYQSWEPNREPYSGNASITCRVDSLLIGYLPDSIVTFSRLSRPYFSAERLNAGPRVLVWLTRGCTYRGNTCGEFNIVGDDGELLHDYYDSDDLGAFKSDARPLRLRDLTPELRRQGAVASLNGAAGIGIAEFHLERRLPGGDVLVRCIAPKWVIPAPFSIPTFVSFPLPTKSCAWEQDTVRYLLPCPPGFRGDTLALSFCPRQLRVVDGRVMMLDLPADSLTTVIARGVDGTLHLRRPR